MTNEQKAQLLDLAYRTTAHDADDHQTMIHDIVVKGDWEAAEKWIVEYSEIPQDEVAASFEDIKLGLGYEAYGRGY